MAKWEYKIVDSRNVTGGGGLFKVRALEPIEAYLNELGATGWEIINLDFRELERGYEFSGVMKREVAE